jgi:hypothetical protein
MNINNMVGTELRSRIPRGAPPQNYFRAAFQQARTHGLGRRATIPPTFEAAVATATSVIRKFWPTFTPTIR